MRNPVRSAQKPFVWIGRKLLRRLGTIPCFVACGISLAGCGSTRPIKYYQLDYPTNVTVAQDVIDTTLIVRPFEASSLYLDDRIIYGFESSEMGAYENHRWAEPPVASLQDALVRGLRSSGRFRGVYSIRADANGQFLLGGHLYDFKEVDGTTIVARLSYEVRLRDRQNAVTVWSHVYNHDEPAAEKSVNAFVLAMDKNVQRSVQEVQVGLEEYFRTHPVK